MMISLLNIAAIFSVLSSSYSYFTFPDMLETGLKSNLNLAENGIMYKEYMNPKIKTRSAFYMYEVTNPKGYLSGKKPKFRVRGPVIFSTSMNRFNISYKNNKESIQFSTLRSLVLVESESKDLDTPMYAVNLIFESIHAGVKDAMKKIPFARISEPIVYSGVNVLVDNFNERLLIKSTPRDLLTVRNVALLQSLSSLATRFGFADLLPPLPTKAGLAYVQNITADTIEIWAGVGSTKEKYGEVVSWKGSNSVQFWTGKCSRIEGTNGELYKPMENEKSRRVFISQLCRSFDLVKISNDTIVSGVRLDEYEIGDKIYQGIQKNPENKCFCSDSKTYDCQYDGFINMAPCAFGAPLYFSRANYVGVDRRIRGLLDSLEDSQVPAKQSFYLEPTTGAPGKVNLTLMASVKVTKQRYLRDVSQIPNLAYMPFFAVNETMLENHKPIFLFLGLAGVIPAILFRGKSSDKTKTADSAMNPHTQSVDTSIKTSADSQSTKPDGTRRRSKASLDVESVSNRNN